MVTEGEKHIKFIEKSWTTLNGLFIKKNDILTLLFCSCNSYLIL